MNLSKSLQLLYLFFVVFFTVSCELINPAEEIPSYIYVDEFTLSTNLLEEGENTHNINDVWIYIEGEFIGIFELPAEIPVLASGENEILLYPGIKVNGIAASRDKYPFYSNYTTSETLSPYESDEDILKLSPNVQYLSETVFEWIENFEDAGLTLDTTYNSTTKIQIKNESGNNFGFISLDDSHIDFECISNDAFVLPQNNTPVYLELDYKNNLNFQIGLIISNPSSTDIQPVISLNPIENWNKIYIDLTYFVVQNINASSFIIFIAASKTDEIDTAEIYIDNLKLIHF
ncbi:MAG: hypothetical protein HOB05_17070 [Bacteroidetes bacterium]|jgi:hypothetical protein|nr:hypothetical protein [Bacteroidota bacterium]MBT7144803.1 hypothetical protein [Bacteroidota bacterium]